MISLKKIFLEVEKSKDSEEESPKAEAQPEPAQSTTPQEPTPQESNDKIESVSSVFDVLKGDTIKNVTFQPISGGGVIKITTANNPVPMTISWSGSTVTATHKNVIKLA
jgi:hypothetical protein